METSTKTRDNYGALLAAATRIDTTANGGNGYPRHLKVAYTADTMGELRELHEAATAEGHEVDVVMLHRRDGWALWERHNRGSEHDLNDDRWMGTSDQDWTITLDNESDCEQEAFATVCGEGYEVEDAADLLAKASAVRELAAELPDPDELEDGENVVAFLDAWYELKYTVRTGQNGYSYDTHHYCTALIITEREEEEED
jgi:hypothetical protein